LLVILTNMKTITIDGDSFSDLATFYDEIEKKFTKDLGWKIGRNLDAFNDVLRGGFGITKYTEPIEVVWGNSQKSKVDLSETFNVILEIIKDNKHIQLELR
jgi:RNAse (barnase) inhibitor barstar